MPAILRDIGEDLGRDRVYLPSDELAAFGVTRAMLDARRVTGEFRRLMRFQVGRARAWFEAGGVAVDLFAPDGSRLCGRLLQRVYAGILAQIERQDYDVFRARAFVPTRRKLTILAGAVWREMVTPAPARA